MADISTINTYNDFVDNLKRAGMTLGGANGEGVFTLCDYFSDNIAWHTMNADTDPWEWRTRILNEHQDIFYSKIFFKKSGYITKEWYPYFYAVRRGTTTLEDEYTAGNISYLAKNIYDYISENGTAPLHIIKKHCNISKENKTKFENAIVELQMKMYITMCGQARKLNKYGAEYGWHAMSYCTVEEACDNISDEAWDLTKDSAYEAIEEQIYSLNPNAAREKVRKFILGR